jgi:hypothetical protein
MRIKLPLSLNVLVAAVTLLAGLALFRPDASASSTAPISVIYASGDLVYVSWVSGYGLAHVDLDSGEIPRRIADHKLTSLRRKLANIEGASAVGYLDQDYAQYVVKGPAKQWKSLLNAGLVLTAAEPYEKRPSSRVGMLSPFSEYDFLAFEPGSAYFNGLKYVNFTATKKQISEELKRDRARAVDTIAVVGPLTVSEQREAQRMAAEMMQPTPSRIGRLSIAKGPVSRSGSKTSAFVWEVPDDKRSLACLGAYLDGVTTSIKSQGVANAPWVSKHLFLGGAIVWFRDVPSKEIVSWSKYLDAQPVYAPGSVLTGEALVSRTAWNLFFFGSADGVDTRTDCPPTRLDIRDATRVG